MELTLKNIAAHTTGLNGNYSVKFELANQVALQYSSIDGWLTKEEEVYQKRGHKDFDTVDSNINTKDDFVRAVKWQHTTTKECEFI